MIYFILSPYARIAGLPFSACVTVAGFEMLAVIWYGGTVPAAYRKSSDTYCMYKL